ncbi:MAG: alkaline phosphatase family protein [Ardenticatenaceae bacterium]|nr:alkaline phosphatase family protein [Ardenticatenaceae bacterium]
MRAVIIGLDAFEPRTFERLYEQGKLPNLGKYVPAGKYSRFAVSNPPQSEVSWTSIATGLNPGGHGMFDFVHRNPANYALNVSLLPTESGFGGTRFAYPFKVTTLFDQAVKQGYPATALWWPALFPARMQSPVRTLPGLGTPDILGRLGVGTFFTTDQDLVHEKGRKTPVFVLQATGNGRYKGLLHGPMRKTRNGVEASTIDVNIDRVDEHAAHIQVDKHQLALQAGQWSPIIELSFKVSRFFSIRAITRFILKQTKPYLEIYALPLQIHPERSPWPYGTPRDFVKKTWKERGPFLTLGWPQDTTALEDGCITDDQFLSLCDDIVAKREQILMYHLDQFKEGVLANVFDTMDRVQHMFWRDRPDVIEAWYGKLDGIVGRVEERLQQRGLKDKTRLVVLSDHGFTEFNHKAHVNRWLVDHGYMQPTAPAETGGLSKVNWAQTQAYAIGLNSIYLNLSGREGKGSVSMGERTAVLDKLCADLLQWQGPDGQPVVQKVWRQQETFDGPLAEYGPDVMVGFAPGYRASAETGLGEWKAHSIEPNNDHWGADHCINPEAVPGVIFSSDGLKNFPNPSYRDIPELTIGVKPDSSGAAPPSTSSGDEDEQAIEERLRSLGYL